MKKRKKDKYSTFARPDNAFSYKATFINYNHYSVRGTGVLTP